MKGRTYRYFGGTPWYPFGFGKSYSTFGYSGLILKRTPQGAEARATVKNTSARDGEEVVQLYVHGGPEADAPLRSLRGFTRIALRAGESREVRFQVAADDLPRSAIDISVGGGQPSASVPFVRASLPAAVLPAAVP
jgi:beta-glucosidase